MFNKFIVCRHSMLRKRLGVGVLALALLSCGAPRPRHGPPGADHGPVPGAPGPGASGPGSPAPGAPAQAAPGTHVYRIDPEQSELRVLVYRAGPMARFGHNHVLINRALEGRVMLAEPRTASSFSMSVPVAGFVVDEPQARQQEGADFPGEIPDDARSGTLHNMQSAAVLDAADFPVVAVDSVAVTQAAGGMIATVAITLKGQVSRIDAPFELAGDSHTLSASGSVELRQSALGLVPFSIFLGALQVEDGLQLKFKITAVEL